MTVISPVSHGIFLVAIRFTRGISQAAHSGVILTCNLVDFPGVPVAAVDQPVTEWIPADVSLTVDKSKVGQVIHNLVSNALKFTPRGGTVTVQARVQFSFKGPPDGATERAGEGELIVEVIDTGTGIAQVRRTIGRVWCRCP